MTMKWLVNTMSSTPLQFVTDFVNSADKAYNLAARIRNDFEGYLSRREYTKIRKELERLRDLVGEIDAMFSKLHVDLYLMEERDPNEYQKHLDDFEEIFQSSQRIGFQILEISEMQYFHKFPTLREKLYWKIGFEATYNRERERTAFWGDYETLKGFVDRVYRSTRDALLALNVHLESEFL